MFDAVGFPHTESLPTGSPPQVDAATARSLKIVAPIKSVSDRAVVPSQEKASPPKQRVSEAVVSNTRLELPLPIFEKRHRVASMLSVEPVDLEQKTYRLLTPSIPETSPLYPWQRLKAGWDGYWAEPLSQEVLLRGHQLWVLIQQVGLDGQDLPVVSPSANGSVAFTWSHHYPRKELEIWLYDQPDYYLEWLLSVEGKQDVESEARSQVELLRAIRKYWES